METTTEYEPMNPARRPAPDNGGGLKLKPPTLTAGYMTLPRIIHIYSTLNTPQPNRVSQFSWLTTLHAKHWRSVTLTQREEPGISIT